MLPPHLPTFPTTVLIYFYFTYHLFSKWKFQVATTLPDYSDTLTMFVVCWLSKGLVVLRLFILKQILPLQTNYIYLIEVTITHDDSIWLVLSSLKSVFEHNQIICIVMSTNNASSPSRNFEAGRAYCFRLVRLFVSPSVRHAFLLSNISKEPLELGLWNFVRVWTNA